MQFSILWGLLIVSSAFYARPLYNSILNFIAREYLIYIIAACILAVFITAISHAFNAKSKFQGRWIYLLIAVLGIAFLFFMLELPEEKIHILLFMGLGLIRVREKPDQINFRLIAFIFFFSLLSESMQGLMPDRVADYRDLIIDTTSGVCGLMIGSTLCRRL